MRIYEGLDEDGGPVDCSVGSLVWVRRRNGSWWPGRILGPEELSASHLMSPRSGTPVKLLGREDASVDWYNLEKSKRVKPFRCGEFDACIERVEASNSISVRKREKYARREDAILHALELEKQQKFGNFSVSISTKMSGSSKNELINFSSEVYMSDDEPRVHSKFASHKSRAASKKSSVRHGEDNIRNSLCSRKVRNGKQLFWEEDIPESLPRMRGLQDFGLRIAPKKKFFPSVAWEASCKPVGNHVDVLSSGMVGGAVHAGSSRKSLFIKRKRTQGGMVEDSLVKKRDRRRPLVQVLQSSAKLPVFHSLETDQDAGVSSIQGKEDDTEAVHRAKRSRCIYLSADPNDSLDHSGCYSEEITTTATQFEMDDRRHQPSLAEECTSSGLSETTESDSTERDFWAAGIEDEMDLLTDDARAVPRSRDHHHSEFQDSNKLSSRMMRSIYTPQLHLDEQGADASAEGGVSKWHMKGKRNARTLPKRPYTNRNLPLRAEPSALARGLYHEDSFGSDSASTDYGNREDSDDDRSSWEAVLVEVDLKVQASYQGEHVPLVSLMSRLNGKAIVGHPIQIEILEGGLGGFDGRPPVWRTGRRSAMLRLPRALDGEDEMGRARTNVSKRTSLSSQKTRTLSSIATEHKGKSKNRNGKQGVLGGLITGVPLVTRVPLKVVFSRILEAIGRPSSARQ